MLAMWHRVMTRPWKSHFPIDKEFYKAVKADIDRTQYRIVTTGIREYASSRRYGDWADIGCAKPIADQSWVEFEWDYQLGVLIRVLRDQQLSDNLSKVSGTYPTAAACYDATIFATIDGEPNLLTGSSLYFDRDGAVVGVTVPQQKTEVMRDYINVSLVSSLASFAFAHCKNVNLVDDPEHGPDAKWCRRQKVPSVVYKTLRIPGFVYKGRVVNNDGSLGEVASEERRMHIVRGHFATYTADKPLFGRASGVGKFWHPAHVRGNMAAGAVVKDYEVVTA